MCKYLDLYIVLQPIDDNDNQGIALGVFLSYGEAVDRLESDKSKNEIDFNEFIIMFRCDKEEIKALQKQIDAKEII